MEQLNCAVNVFLRSQKLNEQRPDRRIGIGKLVNRTFQNAQFKSRELPDDPSDNRGLSWTSWPFG